MEIVHIFFLAFAALAVVAAFNVILQRNPIYSAIALIVVLCCLAVLFLTLYAPFIAAMQIIVYAGAIMVLFVFVIMLLNVREEDARTDRLKYLKFIAPVLFLMLVGQIAFFVSKVQNPPAPLQIPGSVESLAEGLFTKYLVPFEATSVLILMAIVGAMLLARKDKPEEIDRMEQALIDAQAEQSSPADKAETSKEEVAA
ncbi:MAG: NADH-quinone oxidoreductase subunit J [Blastocatellia bacterium]|nr:NADH-quinone oxidoreductase subunit J [Blastocatellia bacterium]